MKHSAQSSYNIYSTKRRNGNNRRKKFVAVCLMICMVCSILDVVFIAKLLKKGKVKEPEATQLSSSETIMTDEAGNILTSATFDSSVPSDVPTETTGKTQTVDAATRAAKLEELKTNISNYIGQQSGRYAVYYINLENGETLGVNETMPIIAASTIKIAYNTYLYEKAESGELSLTETMKYNAAAYPQGDLEYGTGTIQNSADGTEYTLQEVSHLAITISDNCGNNMVIRRLGGEDAINNNYFKTISSMVDYREKVSYTDYMGNAAEGRRRSCALDLAKHTEHTYRDWERNPDHYQPLIDDLCNTEYNWGVPQGVPSNVKVAHKVGFNGASYNDSGIVFGTEDYVLCMMTESGDASKAQQIMGEISRMVYEYIESNYA